MAVTLDGKEMVVAHGKSKFLSHDKVAKLIREAGGCLGPVAINLIHKTVQAPCDSMQVESEHIRTQCI